MSELKIEAGKYYRTRDGRKAFVAARNPFNARFCWMGMIDSISTLCGVTWLESGRFSDTREAHPDDLIAPWTEPRTIERQVRVNAYDGKLCMGMCGVGDWADTPFAKCTLRYTEGQGFEIVGDGKAAP